MPTRSAFSIVARVIALAVILFLCFSVAGAVIIGQDSAGTEGGGATAGILLAVCFINASVMAYLILRSRWAGWPLMAAVFVVFYGVTTFMGQIESAVFITRLPPGMLARLFVAGVVIAAPFAVLAVLILGKRQPNVADATPGTRLVMSPREWAWKLAVIALAYVILYFGFGYYIAWQNPAVVEYYSGVDEGSFFAHMGAVLRDTPWLVPFQMLRAMLWVAIALPVIRMMKGGWPETALVLGLLFGVVMNTQLLLPNPYMPETVRMTHLIETASSNFLFGVLVGWLLRR